MNLRKFIQAIFVVICCLFIASDAFSYYDSLSDRKISSLRRPKILTPLSEKELMSVLKISHAKYFEFEPSKARLAVAWAQVALECGRGAKTYNHNIGNIGATKNQTYYIVSTHNYRHFLTFEEGANAYWKTLSKCSSALQAFDAGDPISAAAALKRCRYYDADENHYSKSMLNLFYRALKIMENNEQDN
jgi:hypothetical protein